MNPRTLNREFSPLEEARADLVREYAARYGGGFGLHNETYGNLRGFGLSRHDVDRAVNVLVQRGHAVVEVSDYSVVVRLVRESE